MPKNVFSGIYRFPSLFDAAIFFAYATGATGAFIPRQLIDLLVVEDEELSPMRLAFLVEIAETYAIENAKSMRNRGRRCSRTLNSYQTTAVNCNGEFLRLNYQARSTRHNEPPCALQLFYSYELGAERAICEVSVYGNPEGVSKRTACGYLRRFIQDL